MKNITFYRNAALFIITSLICIPSVSAQKTSIGLRVLGTYATGIYNQGASEIVAYDAQTQRLFTVNGATSKIDVLSIANPSSPTLLFSIELAPYGRQANSVDVRNGIVAVAVEANVKTDNGKVVFFNAFGNYLNAVTVGALPDMLTFTPDGTKVLVANEGEPNDAYTIDPEGSVSVVDISSGVASATSTTAGFLAFNNATLSASIRIFGPNATVAQDLEPEYIAVSEDSKTAWVTLQENNAVGVLNLSTGEFTKLIGLG
ncbi:MAG: alkaline phosphatase, partial [Acidobacteriota bacterium]|nr:alkaline phosphatase [Acidobacteriota bacterium]